MLDLYGIQKEISYMSCPAATTGCSFPEKKKKEKKILFNLPIPAQSSM